MGKKFERVLETIARENHTTADSVRREMEKAIREGVSSPDPAVSAAWDAIPKKGEVPTPEELCAFLAGKLQG